eukprot:COSAG03_NODE_8495_length_797_cov_0.989971_2_plen_68_part_01
MARSTPVAAAGGEEAAGASTTHTHTHTHTRTHTHTHTHTRRREGGGSPASLLLCCGSFAGIGTKRKPL